MQVVRNFGALILCLIWVTPSLAQGSPESLTAKWQKMLSEQSSRQSCLFHIDQGYRAGKLYYEIQVPSCPQYLLLAQSGINLFQHLSDLTISTLNVEEECYDSGWRYGYLEAHNALWDACSMELSKHYADNAKDLLSRCEETAQTVLTHSLTIQDVIGVLNADEKKHYQYAFKSLGFLQAADPQSAWRMLLDSIQDDLLGMPCLASLMIHQ